MVRIKIPDSNKIILSSQTDEVVMRTPKNKINVITPYELPPATYETLGGVIIGENLLIDDNGVLSVDVTNEINESNHPITARAIKTFSGSIDRLTNSDIEELLK